MSLAKARSRRDKAREQVADGIDPIQVRKAQKAAKVNLENSFEVIAREWHAKYMPSWTPRHAKTILRRLELNVLAYFLHTQPALSINLNMAISRLLLIDSNSFSTS